MIIQFPLHVMYLAMYGRMSSNMSERHTNIPLFKNSLVQYILLWKFDIEQTRFLLPIPTNFTYKQQTSKKFHHLLK